MNDKLREALAIVEKYGMKGDVIYKEIEALAKPDPQATTTNKHTERAELIRELKELAEALPFEGGKAMDYAAELVAKAAAMLEAQRPALRPLTYIDKENLPLSTGQSCLAYAGPGPANFNRAAVYTRPHQQAEVRVPEGYVLVPVEPTDDMLQCAQDRFYSLLLVDARSIWDAML